MWGKEEEASGLAEGKNYQGYSILGILGCGTFGKVYKVTLPRTRSKTTKRDKCWL